MPESPGTYPDQPQWRTNYHRLIWGRSASLYQLSWQGVQTIAIADDRPSGGKSDC